MSLAQTTMLSKLTWQPGLLQHELILTYIFEKNKTSFIKAENAGNLGSAARVELFCQMTIMTSSRKVTQAMVPHLWPQESFQEQGRVLAASTLHKNPMVTTTTHLSKTQARHLQLYPAPVGPQSTPCSHELE